MVTQYPSPLTLKGLTVGAQKKVTAAGYIDITALKLADIADKRDSGQEVLDFKNVSALVNFNEAEPYQTVVITLDNHIFAVRHTANRLLKKLGNTFVLDRAHMKRDICPALDITRLVPYVCGDYWLMPMSQVNGNNTSWLRWMHRECEVIYKKQATILAVWRSVPQLWSISKKQFLNRWQRCRKIAAFLQTVAESITTLGDFKQSFDILEVTKEIDLGHIAQINKKYGRPCDLGTLAQIHRLLQNDRVVLIDQLYRKDRLRAE